MYYYLDHFADFSKIILCFFTDIISLFTKIIHLVDPLPSVFISLFIMIFFGDWCMAGRLI